MTGPAIWQRSTRPASQTDQQGLQATAGAKVVQHHFVRAQLHHLNTHGRNGLVAETVAALRANVPSLRTASDAELTDLFWRMTQRLQAAKLTINFEATSWFAAPNPYDSYTQMYERGIRGFAPGASGEKVSQMVIKDDAKNPAVVRANADDRATFGAHMRNPDGSFKPEYGGIGRMMSTGGLTRTGTDAKGQAEYMAANLSFTPKAKQVFAALDYGRRPHGASTHYGKSVLVLADKLKTNALYFAGDTFFASDQAQAMIKSQPAGTTGRVTAADQVSFALLGGLYAKAGLKLREDLNRVFSGGTLTDTADAGLLVEAHLFEPLVFRGGLERILVVLVDPQGAPLDRKTAATVTANATAWAARQGVGVRFSKV